MSSCQIYAMIPAVLLVHHGERRRGEIASKKDLDHTSERFAFQKCVSERFMRDPRKILFCVLYLLTPTSQSFDGIVKNKFLCIVLLWHVPELIRSVKWQEIKFLHFETDSGHINGAHHGISVCSLVVLVYKHR